MNPPQPVVAGGPVGTAARGWLAAVLPVLKRSFPATARRGGRATGRVEELFQWLCAIGIDPLQRVLAGGLVGTSVLGWLAALLRGARQEGGGAQAEQYRGHTRAS